MEATSAGDESLRDVRTPPLVQRGEAMVRARDGRDAVPVHVERKPGVTRANSTPTPLRASSAHNSRTDAPPE